jgi:aspartate/methionine/tyrosine aminotransferase
MSAKIDPFRAVTISRMAHRLASAGRSVIHMEFGQPSTGAPPAAVAAAHRLLDTDPLGYWESNPLKERIARHYADAYRVVIDPEQVILTGGASPGLVLALSCLFAPGDRIAFARPGYVAYRNVVKALHLAPVEIGCGEADRFQLTAAAIERVDPAPHGLILASPANPTGTIIPPDELAAIAAACRRRGIRIISDEVYHGLSYVGAARSVAQEEPDALILNSFSKYFSMAGWRLGWLIVPPALIDAARARMGLMFLSPPTLAQHAGLAAFDCVDELEGHVQTYSRNRAMLLGALPALGLRRVAPPDGAFYLYADVGHLTDDSLRFCEQLLSDTGVATAPGIDFDPVHGQSFMRFSFAASSDRIEEAIRRMEPWFRERANAL